MNCSGYAELKAYLKMNAEKRSQISVPHGANEFLAFFKSINNEEFDALILNAAEQIAGAERVIFVGAGTSGTLGRYGARFFSNIGKFSNHIDDPYYPVNTDMYKQAITSDNKSTLAQMADFNISYHAARVVVDNEYDITTQVPVIYIIESIGRQLAKTISAELSQGVSFP